MGLGVGAVVGILIPSLLGEVSLPTTTVRNQKKFPYCALYAMTSYLELTATVQSGASEKLEPGFLALGYNVDFGDGTTGTNLSKLLHSVQQFGVVPKSAWNMEAKTEEEARVIADWKERHQGNISRELALSILERPFDRDGKKMSGSEYLRQVVKLDFSDYEVVNSSTPMDINFVDAQESTETKEPPAPTTRVSKVSSPEDLYEGIYQELYRGRPVLIGIDPDFIRSDFASVKVLRKGDLYEDDNYGAYFDFGGHAMVAVGHCDKLDSQDPLCSRFTEEMKCLGVEECVVVQNSWGTEVHENGRVCIAPDALERLTMSAILPKEEVVVASALQL